ncbi:MAG: aminopeptidase [Desulfuromonadales bacterium]|nr:aminopeptidase [Desulfuromonadales bacterium]
MRKKRLLLPLALILSGGTLLSMVACANMGYYARATQGHLSLITSRKPIKSLIVEPSLNPKLRANLERVLAIRDFASRELRLPENGSYRSYVEVPRPHVVWNVVATPEFDLRPVQWCFPVAGCVNYRGFFSPEEAGAFAEGLREKGHDVYMYGVNAYSTLGWFDDPVLSTFFTRAEEDLAGLIFHELSHQVAYVKNDTTFNESFAKAVEMEGVARWLAAKGEEERIQSYLENSQRHEEFVSLVKQYQRRLQAIYHLPVEEKAKRDEKVVAFRELREAHEQLKESSWGGYKGYDRWFAELNNAKIASINTYYTHVPAFQALLRRHHGNLPAFYQQVKNMGRLPYDRRQAQLAKLHSEFVADLPPVGARLSLKESPSGGEKL